MYTMPKSMRMKKLAMQMTSCKEKLQIQVKVAEEQGRLENVSFED